MKAYGFETSRNPDQALAMTPMDGLIIPADTPPLTDYMNTSGAPAGTIASFHVPSYENGNPHSFGDKVSLTVNDTPKGKLLVVVTKDQQGKETVQELPFKKPGERHFGRLEGTNAFGYEIGILPPSKKGEQSAISLKFSSKKGTYKGSGEPNFPNVNVSEAQT